MTTTAAHPILTPPAMFARVVGGTIPDAVAAGRLPSAPVEAWWKALRKAEAANRFLAGFSGFLICGRVL